MLIFKTTEYNRDVWSITLCKKKVLTTAEEILHAPNMAQNIKWTIKNKR